MKLERIDLAGAVTVALMASATAWVGVNGPAGPVPLHMNLNGAVDRWGTSAELAFIMGLVTLMAATVAVLLAVLKRHPATAEQARRSPAGFLVGRIIGLAAPALAVGLMAALALGGVRSGDDQTTLVRGATAFLAVTFFVVGAMLGKTAPNAFVGVRTYWSLTSRLAWDKSNRLAGRLFFWIGLIGLPAAAVGPAPLTQVLLISAVLIAGALAVFESWRVWRADAARQIA